MRLPLCALLVVGCGGGSSLPQAEPKVAIRSTLCSVFSTGLVNVNVDYEVTLDVGQAFEGVIMIAGTSGSQPFNTSFSCDGWSSTPAGSENVGCQRDVFEQPEIAFITQFFDSQPNPLPPSVSVSILGSALDEPLSDVMVANASTTVPCPLQD